LLLQPPLLARLQGQVNNNGATPLLVAATWGQREVYGRLLMVATAEVLHRFTMSGEATGRAMQPLHTMQCILPTKKKRQGTRVDACDTVQ
jgi:hypothetical protein